MLTASPRFNLSMQDSKSSVLKASGGWGRKAMVRFEPKMCSKQNHKSCTWNSFFTFSLPNSLRITQLQEKEEKKKEREREQNREHKIALPSEPTWMIKVVFANFLQVVVAQSAIKRILTEFI